MKRGITFIEILIAVLLLGGAILSFTGVVLRDMRNVRYAAWDAVAQNVGETELDRLARYLGNNGIDTNANGICDGAEQCGVDDDTLVPDCPATLSEPPPAAMVFETNATLGSPLQNLPWARGLRCKKDFGFADRKYYPDAKLVTVIVQVYYGGTTLPAGVTPQEWRFVTVVAPGGMDKT